MNKVIAILLVFLSMDSHAKSCVSSYVISESKNKFEDLVKYSDVVFTGESLASTKHTFKEKGKPEGLVETSSKFIVAKALKGKVDQNVSVRGIIGSTCECPYYFEPGVSYLVFAKQIDSELYSVFCKYIKPIEQVPIAELKKAING